VYSDIKDAAASTFSLFIIRELFYASVAISSDVLIIVRIFTVDNIYIFIASMNANIASISGDCLTEYSVRNGSLGIPNSRLIQIVLSTL
jgi:hypothetical protein